MIIVAGGDSFIFGNELADCTGGVVASRSTWPAILARDGYTYQCTAAAGVGNSAIARRVMNYCQHNPGEKFVVVQWTFPARYEFQFNFETGHRDPWYTIGPWDLLDIKEIEDEYHNEDKFTLWLQKKHHDQAQRSGVYQFAREYLQSIGDSQFWENYTTLKEIVLLQNYLKVNSIPYMFACADNCIITNVGNDVDTQTLYQQIDFTRWAWFPAGTHNGETFGPRGFYQWALESKYKMGTTHPLEQAHSAAADLMKERFDELVKKNIQ
jgi:hypothetical protein